MVAQDAGRATARILRILWVAWSKARVSKLVKERKQIFALNFQNHQHAESQSFPWVVPLLALQILLGLAGLTVWLVRLVRRGRQLAKQGEEGSREDQEAHQDEDTTVVDSQLYKLAKSYHFAKLALDLEETKKKVKLLSDYLDSEYARIKRNCRKDMKPRQLMMKKIRCVLVKHPHDQVGRQMASDTKAVFKCEVLKEKGLGEMLAKYVKIPDVIKENKTTLKVLALTPIFLATFGVCLRGAVYGYDMYSDIEVMKELDKNIQNFTVPQIRKTDNLEIEIEQFILNDILEMALPMVTDSCELLDLIEVIPNDNLPFYETVVTNLAGVHWNPNRNTELHLSDIFNITNYVAHFYEQVMTATSEYKDQFEKPSDIPKFTKMIIDELNEGKEKLRNAKQKLKNLNWLYYWILDLFTGWGKDINVYVTEIDKYVGKVNTAIELLSGIDEKIIKSELGKKVLREGDISYSQRLFDETTFLELLKEFSTEIKQKFNPISMKSYEYRSSFDFSERPINQSDNECRKYVKRLFELGNNAVIKKAVLTILTEMKSDSNVDEMSQRLSERMKFITIHIIRGAYFSLILTFAWTLVLEAKKIMSEFFKAGHLPLLTNFQLTYDENHPESALLDGENTSNSYLYKSSNRFLLSIHEATTETTSAINIQIALWIYMATFLVRAKAILKDSINFDITNEMFGFENDAFTDFSASPMLTSLIGGIISLTFAQYNQYKTRHEKDMTLLGTIVYILSCAFNTLAILLSQITFFALGFPFFTNFVLIIIRYLVNIDQYDNMPASHQLMIVSLVIVIVLLPLRLLPTVFAKILQHLTDTWVLHKTHQINLRNRSGYDVPGIETALFMFLPSANNTHGHIFSKGSTANPGFFYFSKDPLSKKLYRLRFELQLFHKLTMHLFYLIGTFIFLNTIDILLLEGMVVDASYWFEVLNTKYVMALGKVPMHPNLI